MDAEYVLFSAVCCAACFCQHVPKVMQKRFYLQAAGDFLKMDVILRVYDEGLAFRYHIAPDDVTPKQLKLTSDNSQFCFAGDYGSWSYNRENRPHGSRPAVGIVFC